MMLGMGNVGKSWLFRRCFMDERINKDIEPRNSTHDIELMFAENCWFKPVVKIGEKSHEIGLRVWDFGGQLVLHGVHETFLEDDGKTVYILVLNAGRVPGNGTGWGDHDSGNRIYYWLRSLQHFAGSKAPIIIAITQCDEFENSNDRPVDIRMGLKEKSVKNYNIEELSFEYQVSVAGIVDNCSSTSTSEVSNAAILRLRRTIETACQDFKRKVPPKFPRLIRMVRQECIDSPLFTVEEYRRWCCQPGIGLNDHGYQDGLLRSLHFGGELFYFGRTEAEVNGLRNHLDSMAPGRLRRLKAHRDEVLQNYVFNPQHLKRCVYTIIRDSESVGRQGWFSTKEIDDTVDSSLNASTFSFTLSSHDNATLRTAVRAFLTHIQLSWFDEQQQKYLFPRGLGIGHSQWI